jgi:hypothetical protein
VDRERGGDIERLGGVLERGNAVACSEDFEFVDCAAPRKLLSFDVMTSGLCSVLTMDGLSGSVTVTVAAGAGDVGRAVVE